VNAVNVLNNTSSAEFQERFDVVSRSGNHFADVDSYFNKGADYGFYFELKSGSSVVDRRGL